MRKTLEVMQVLPKTARIDIFGEIHPRVLQRVILVSELYSKRPHIAALRVKLSHTRIHQIIKKAVEQPDGKAPAAPKAGKSTFSPLSKFQSAVKRFMGQLNNVQELLDGESGKEVKEDLLKVRSRLDEVLGQRLELLTGEFVPDGSEKKVS